MFIIFFNSLYFTPLTPPEKRQEHAQHPNIHPITKEIKQYSLFCSSQVQKSIFSVCFILLNIWLCGK